MKSSFDFLAHAAQQGDEWRAKRRKEQALENSRKVSFYSPQDMCAASLWSVAPGRSAILDDGGASKFLYQQELARLEDSEYPNAELAESTKSISEQHAEENRQLLQNMERLFAQASTATTSILSSSAARAAAAADDDDDKMHVDEEEKVQQFPKIASREEDHEILQIQQELESYQINHESIAVRIEAELMVRTRDALVQDVLREELAEMVLEAASEVEQEEEVSRFADFDMDVVQEAFEGGPANQVLIEKFNIPLTRANVHSLLPLEWLNDEVINFWFNLLDQRDVDCRHHFFNSFFFSKLVERKQYNYINVRRWTRKFDIFARDQVFIPVNIQNTHWCLAVIFMRTKTIQYYDSMFGSGLACLKYLLRYLQDESLHKKKVPLDVSEWTLVPTQEGTPQQMNGSDCGVFTCTFADCLSLDLPFDFSQEDMPTIRHRMVAKLVQGSI